MEDSASTAAGPHATGRGRWLLPVAASALAVVQNLCLFAFGLKEGFQPLFFAPCAVEVGLCWLGWVVARRVVVRWCLAVLLVAELLLPVSTFNVYVRSIPRRIALAGIRVEHASTEPLPDGVRLRYTLRFPRRGQYLTFPAFLGTREHPVAFGDYVPEHREYLDDDYVFEAGKSYDFAVDFETKAPQANIDVCDGRDYFMQCRVMAIPLAE
jgi:hypothetical protein